MDDLFFKKQLASLVQYENGVKTTCFMSSAKSTMDFVSRVQEIYEENQALKAKIQELEQFSKWQPIDTAPNGGEYVILYNDKWVAYPVACLDFDYGSDGYVWEILDDEDPILGCASKKLGLRKYFEDYYKPTHWLPFPEAPKVEEE